MDTNEFKNIAAYGATIADIGSKKQISYTIFPGEGKEISATADVNDFEMSAISINGIKLKLGISVNDSELLSKVTGITDAVDSVDDSTSKVRDGAFDALAASGSLTDGALSSKNGAAELDMGVTSLQSGTAQIEAGLNELNSESGTLKAGSLEFKTSLNKLSHALESSVGYAQYKAAMKNVGLDTDALVAGNTQAISNSRHRPSPLHQI